jgi:holo-[acyl-carrier protein] synthase
MIIGVGIDLVEVARIRASVERFGERFLTRILHPSEMAYCKAYKDPAENISGLFSAKEAISKAFGTGIGKSLGWRDMEICHRESGEPYIVLHGSGSAMAAQRKINRTHVSISHTTHYATAVAILESCPEVPPASAAILAAPL